MAINVDDTVIFLFLRSPISQLPASSFPKGSSERLRRWREAASPAGLVGGWSYRQRRTILPYVSMIVIMSTITIIVIATPTSEPVYS